MACREHLKGGGGEIPSVRLRRWQKRGEKRKKRGKGRRKKTSILLSNIKKTGKGGKGDFLFDLQCKDTTFVPTVYNARGGGKKGGKKKNRRKRSPDPLPFT